MAKNYWLTENTRIFLQTDISLAQNIVSYRKKREDSMNHLKIRADIYICPFQGFINKAQTKTGCLLHPKGSPHAQISLWDHPQNFSFYGEGICLSYDCLNKERAQMVDKLLPTDSFVYSRLAGNFNLWQAFNYIMSHFVQIPESSQASPGEIRNLLTETLLGIVIHYLRKKEIPITSFEDVQQIPANRVWPFLGMLLDPCFYLENMHVGTAKRQEIRGKTVLKLWKRLSKKKFEMRGWRDLNPWPSA